MIRKVFVEVAAKFDIDGKLTPVSIKWEDGRIYSIDKVLEIRKAASLKAGGRGIRYHCRIHNQETFLFYDEPQWFVEGK